jgi:hypothetical protein
MMVREQDTCENSRESGWMMDTEGGGAAGLSA